MNCRHGAQINAKTPRRKAKNQAFAPLRLGVKNDSFPGIAPNAILSRLSRLSTKKNTTTNWGSSEFVVSQIRCCVLAAQVKFV